MSDTMDPMATDVDQQELAQQLLAQAREQGIDLVGPDGLLNRLTKNVLETALEAEMDEHLGYEKHDVSGRGSGNSRNGTRTKTVLTEIGPVEIDVPRDTGSTFDPQIVKKRQRRLTGVDEIVLSLSAKGPHDRGDRGPLRRGVRRQGLQGHHLADHREGHRGDDRVAEPAPGPGLPGGVHRRDPRQGPRRAGHEPAGLRRDRCQRQRRTRHPRAVGRGRRRRGEVLALGADRNQEPRRRGRLHHGLRRAQGPARGHHHSLGSWPWSRPASCT